MDVRSYGSFDGRFRNNNCISFYDIYCRLRCLWITSEGWKCLQQLYWWMLEFCIIHKIGVHYHSKVYLYTYVDDYIWKWMFLRTYTYCHLYIYHWNCTYSAWLYNQKKLVYRKCFLYIAKAHDFLVFNVRCTPWEWTMTLILNLKKKKMDTYQNKLCSNEIDLCAENISSILSSIIYTTERTSVIG